MMGSNRKTLLLDFGGVLSLDFDSESKSTLCAMLNIENGALVESLFANDHSRLALVGAISDSELWDRLCGHFGVDRSTMDFVWDMFWRSQIINDELLVLLDECRKRGVNVSVLSNMWCCGGTRMRSLTRLTRLIDQIIISGEEYCRKPGREIFDIAISRLGCFPEDILFVDDDARNVSVALSLSMSGLVFNDTRQGNAFIEQWIRR
ncbi:hypothetical protein [Bosea sp. 685]|uniref:hypothetical protein n=1 Tax=Bosea sp. 685 TaxID=3080057 RepID=UPI002892A163|nr:hypothetical protein [Bosea sp. 685]WNJ89613.1 hypothetical protein RMR04_24910 [Bosea sp. 685]